MQFMARIEIEIVETKKVPVAVSKKLAKNFCYQNIFDKIHIVGYCKPPINFYAGDLSQF